MLFFWNFSTSAAAPGQGAARASPCSTSISSLHTFPSKSSHHNQSQQITATQQLQLKHLPYHSFQRKSTTRPPTFELTHKLGDGIKDLMTSLKNHRFNRVLLMPVTVRWFTGSYLSLDKILEVPTHGPFCEFIVNLNQWFVWWMNFGVFLEAFGSICRGRFLPDFSLNTKPWQPTNHWLWDLFPNMDMFRITQSQDLLGINICRVAYKQRKASTSNIDDREFDIDRTKNLLHLLFPKQDVRCLPGGFSLLLPSWLLFNNHLAWQPSQPFQVTDLTFTANSAGSVGLKVFCGPGWVVIFEGNKR